MTQSRHGCLSGEDLESPRSLGAGSPVAQVAQAGLCPCAFVPSCQLEAVFGGPLPFSHWAPYLGQSQHYCGGRSILAVLKLLPEEAMLGKRK